MNLFTLKAAALAIALGASIIATVPAQAFGFDDDDFFPICMTDYQIRNAIEDEGYTHIFLNVVDEDGDVQVKATKDGIVYLLDFDSCAGQIDDEEEL
jgi:hypothetical protein